jgi:CheY-like chemotaxis protein
MSAMLRVLLVDDNAALRGDAAGALESSGLEVVGAVGDGCAAVQAARHLLPDLVLIDDQMPLMDGLTAARLILAGPEPPVVVLWSGDAGPELRARALRVGVRAVIQKGAAPQALREALLRVGGTTRPRATRMI